MREGEVSRRLGSKLELRHRLPAPPWHPIWNYRLFQPFRGRARGHCNGSRRCRKDPCRPDDDPTPALRNAKACRCDVCHCVHRSRLWRRRHRPRQHQTSRPHRTQPKWPMPGQQPGTIHLSRRETQVPEPLFFESVSGTLPNSRFAVNLPHTMSCARRRTTC